ncbi:MAG: putative baseplate assembly protein [Actinomycetales bacterium]|nr:putative baseplate assembly protein [Actinomycetales bacterium]
MALPAPDLDDRRFQQLVDDAKRLVQQRCPDWTDHNVSDPGVTLIEAFAQMVDQLIYRLNRVPDRNYVKFLEMIGVELRSSAAARGAVTFWLSAPQPQTVLVRAGSEVATPRTDLQDPLVFTTLKDLHVVPCSFAHAAVRPLDKQPAETTRSLDTEQGFACFSRTPQVGDELLVGLSDPVPSCAVLLRLDCTVAGVGVDPRRPPLVWEAWQGTDWVPCQVDSDGTGGLNRPGDIVLHVPDTHQASVIARHRAGWLRCRLVEAEPEQPTYTASPRIMGIEAMTVGGTTGYVHAEIIGREDVGRSDGTPGQRMRLSRHPVLPADDPVVLEVVTDAGSEAWEQVAHFAASGPEDRHFRLDAYAGEVQFGPAVRQADGGLRYYGAVPPRGASVQIQGYRCGGGRRGNVAAGQIRVLKSSVPYVGSVENRTAAVGGADPETLEDAKVRGPMLLRSRGRAVTAEDFVELTLEVAPDVARVECVTSHTPEDAGGVRLLVVPHVASDDLGRVERTELDPPEATLERISESLDQRRLIGTRILVTPPDYVWVTAVVSVTALPQHDPQEVRDAVLRALYRHFHPLQGGPDGTGWPFGRHVQAHELHATLAHVPGVDMSEEISVSLFPAEAGSGRRDKAVQRVDLGPTSLVYSYEHQVRVR